MEKTTHYEFNKPEGTDTIDVTKLNDNMDSIDTLIYGLSNGKKPVQTAVSDPTASGTSLTFISGITQDTNGVITPAKKTVQDASSAQAGLVSTGTQTFAGAKTFENAVAVSDDTESTDTSTGALVVAGGIASAKNIRANKVWNAVWNDYAECRPARGAVPGMCVTENYDGIMTPTKSRLEPACRIVSDTFGYCMGETDKARTPVAVSGRVLAKCYRPIIDYQIGDAVCSAPDGCIDVMSRREVRKYPDRIVGIVSEIPRDAVWRCGTEENPKFVSTEGRIWIYVR